MILRNRLAMLLFNQEQGYRSDIKFEHLPEHQMDDYLKRADEIIQFFVDAIKNLEFNLS